jgi:hypothetical protein
MVWVVQSMVVDYQGPHRKGQYEFHQHIPYIYLAQPIETEDYREADSGLAMGTYHNNNEYQMMYLFGDSNLLRNGQRILHLYNLGQFYMVLNLSNRIVHI